MDVSSILLLEKGRTNPTLPFKSSTYKDNKMIHYNTERRSICYDIVMSRKK